MSLTDTFSPSDLVLGYPEAGTPIPLAILPFLMSSTRSLYAVGVMYGIMSEIYEDFTIMLLQSVYLCFHSPSKTSSPFGVLQT